MKALAKVAKAITAALAAASAAAVASAQDGTVTNAEWLTIVVALAAAGYATWKIPNAPAAPSPVLVPAVDEHDGVEG